MITGVEHGIVYVSVNSLCLLSNVLFSIVELWEILSNNHLKIRRHFLEHRVQVKSSSAPDNSHT